ncbi:methylase of peptide chain release factor [Corynebacterium sp. HMSC22B11]|uniref:N5-glutamine methyltransferase family protein n=1 Tax=Corynebacterium sp. HMSC22B11 TaxID=1581056 RepID=UPI0008A206E6|nr:HemK/PrmC family methyltransferase [Corynebacterium sp. HMSC22B11]OFO12175.1 methylase of peptide chain release factor [Corynebacterium sp. HMSC22B11]
MATVSEAVRTAARQFSDAGLASPLNDARWLMAYALAGEGNADSPRTPAGLTEVFAASGDPEPVIFAEWVARRARREPLQHIVGAAPFFGYDLYSDSRGFIPRPETELLTEYALGRIRAWLERAAAEPNLRPADGVVRVVDLCAGPGTIGLALAAQLAEFLRGQATSSPADYRWLRTIEVTGIELDPAAVELGQENLTYFRRAGLLGEQLDVRLVEGDVRDLGLLDDLGLAGRAQLVVANPPYVPSGSRTDVETGADPAIAVFSGDDGLELMPHVATAIVRAAAPGAQVAVEHDDATGDQTREILIAAGLSDVEKKQDFADRDRFVVGRAAPRQASQ